jgi:4-aminobutyrate aminotransferase
VDRQGRRILDFHGNSVHQVGYGHPHVIAAIKKQLDKLPFSPRRYTNEEAIRLADKLGRMAPGDLNKVLFVPGGAEAVGLAMKLARYATNGARHKTISFWDSFHGASLDTISIGGESMFRRGAGPLLPGCEHAPPPVESSECVFGCNGDCTLRCANYIRYIMEREGDVCAVIAEPMRCTTVVRAPRGYWEDVRNACDEHGVSLIFDEIPTGLGRTGKMFSCEHDGVVPDILVIGKGLGGGVFPLAAVIVSEKLARKADEANATDLSLGHYTHEKSSVGCAAALATLEVIEEEKLLERGQRLGESALKTLSEMKSNRRLIGEVRGLGLQLAVELRDDEGRPAVDEAEEVMYLCMKNGLAFKTSNGNVLTLSPPLTIKEEHLDKALQIVDDAISGVEKRMTSTKSSR